MSVYYNARRPAEGDADTAAVLKMEIPWSTYLTARLISDQDYKLIERYDRRAEDLQASLLDEVGRTHFPTQRPL